MVRKSASKSTARTKGAVVPPIHTLRLMDVVGPTRAARDLGTSTTTLYKAQKHKLVSRVIEVAAEGVLRSIGTTSGSAPSHLAPRVSEPLVGAPVTEMVIFEATPAVAVQLRKIAAKLGATVVD